jgi:transcriptional regulator with XRE-family HTH domain
MGKQLSGFILNELRVQNISIRELSRRSGINHVTLAQIANDPDHPRVTIDTLAKLSKATGAPLLDLIRMEYPEVATLDTTPAGLAHRYNQLTPQQQAVIRQLIDGMIINRDRHDD